MNRWHSQKISVILNVLLTSVDLYLARQTFTDMFSVIHNPTCFLCYIIQ